MFSHGHYTFVILTLGEKDENGLEQVDVYTLDTLLKQKMDFYTTDYETRFLNTDSGKLWYPHYPKKCFGPISTLLLHQIVKRVFPA